jgi:hypothetical protein
MMSGSCFEDRFTRDLRRAPERSSGQATAVEPAFNAAKLSA